MKHHGGRNMKKKMLLISGHDYRSKRRTNTHFVAKALSSYYELSFFSIGFSWIAELIGRDPRIGSGIVPNVWEDFEGVHCYLDKRIMHPGGLSGRLPEVVSSGLFRLFEFLSPPVLKELIRASDIILVESGIGTAALDYIYRVFPSAEVLYLASDDLETVNCAPYLCQTLARNAVRLRGIFVPSKKMAGQFPSGANVFFVPHGLNEFSDLPGPSPFSRKGNAVSVGSMLFDPSFFTIACDRFPQIVFHVIGSGNKALNPRENLVLYDEMDYNQTLGYIRHADIGIAPYRKAEVPYYLSDTSLKLMHYEAFGVPAVCPFFAVGEDHAGRFGYEPGDPSSIDAAIKSALHMGRRTKPVRKHLTWDEVAKRFMAPRSFEDTRIAGPVSEVGR